MAHRTTITTMLVLCGIFSLIVPALVDAAVPQTINYQGYLTNASGQPVDRQVDIIFTLYKSDNSQVWTETQNNVVVTKGVYSVMLGSVASLSAIPFDELYYLGLKIGDDPEMSPRQPLTSVGYALRSGLSDSAATGAVTADSLAAGAVTPAKLANICVEGDFLVKTSGGWACSSSVTGLASTKRPWGCSADRTTWDLTTCTNECTADAVSPSVCADFCGNSALAALVSGGHSVKYCSR